MNVGRQVLTQGIGGIGQDTGREHSVHVFFTA